MEIAGKKAENIKKSGADVVATACPGCIIQLKDGLHRAGIQTEVKHVVELL
ncbi:MAG: (Fe-S)-binding protein [Deltaproteobacteria bacterium]|nr:(Fe-S)-binding protein [Deltaproteobacteria bacterium]